MFCELFFRYMYYVCNIMYVCMHACMYVLFTQVITFELIVPMYKLANNTLLLKSFASMQSL
jgi:hypothetical protein